MFKRIGQQRKKINKVATRARSNRSLHFSLCEPRILLHAAALVTEVMFQPSDPTTAEIGGSSGVVADDFEFIELRNPERQQINLAGVRFSGDVNLVFSNEIFMQPSEIAVVVANSNAFRLRYGDSPRILGQWNGALDDQSANFSLIDSDDHEITEFSMSTDGHIETNDWPFASFGAGASLEIVDDSQEREKIDRPQLWDASTTFGGTPGESRSHSSDIVINEVIANSVIRDSIELFNRGDHAIDIGGWYLSDSSEDLLKYQLPQEAIIAPGAFFTVFEDEYKQASPTGFDFSSFSSGEVWLSEANANSVTRLWDQVSFGPQRLNIAWGRPAESESEFVPLVQTSVDVKNHEASFGPVIIGEIHFNPAQPTLNALEIDPAIRAAELEFVEIYNSSDESIEISGWQLTGATEYRFPHNTILPPYETAVVLSFDPYAAEQTARLKAFKANYQVDDFSNFFGPTSANLHDDFGRLNLLQTANVKNNLDALFLTDITRFDDEFPWPAATDGQGQSLVRLNVDSFGANVAGWEPATPSPGETSLVPRPSKTLVVSEIMISPLPPNATELSIVNDAAFEDFQFIEFLNPNDRSLDLAEILIDGDVDFQTSGIKLNPKEVVVVAANVNAFRARYGDEIRIIGQWSGQLSNQQTKITGTTGTENQFANVTIDWNRTWPLRAQGAGASIELVEPARVEAPDYDRPQQWAGSTKLGGTPGMLPSNPIDLRINEVFSNSGLALRNDSIELVNLGGESIDISGWYLSNDRDQLQKYQIPANTVVKPGEFRLFEQSRFNFDIDGIHGDEVWLTKLVAGNVETFIDEVAFNSQLNGTSISRFSNQADAVFHRSELTLGDPNLLELPGPVYISEINFRPLEPTESAIALDNTIQSDDLEFIELYNTSNDPIDLAGWRIQGTIDFKFSRLEIGGQETLFLVPFDPIAQPTKLAAFRSHYQLADDDSKFAGGFNRRLNNRFGFIDLLEAADPPVGEPNFTPLIQHDQARYDVLAPWPQISEGQSLSRIAGSIGGLSTSWEPTPANLGDTNLAPDPMLVTEIMYAPLRPSDREQTALPNAETSDFAFIEVFNPNDNTELSLSNLKISGDIEFVFSNYKLAPHEYAVVVDDARAFLQRYGHQIRILGEWSGDLNHESQFSIALGNENPFFDVHINSDDRWPTQANGVGSSLQFFDDSDEISNQGHPSLWNASVEFNGSPGRPGIDRRGIVINEFMANSSGFASGDTIELLNTTIEAVDVGGWYLSDSQDELLKYQIPANTSIQPGGYLVIEQSHIESHFTLDGANGEQLWLIAAEAGVPTEFVDYVSFGPQVKLITAGRSPNGAGPFVIQQEVTLGSDNSAPNLSELLISEIHFQSTEPSILAKLIDANIDASNLQFIELYNATDDDLELFGWNLAGSIQLVFPEQTTIGAHELIVVVNFDTTEFARRVQAFRTHYGIDATVRVVGGFEGDLEGFGRVGLARYSTADGPPFLPAAVRDEVRYDNISPWPSVSTGQSLNRLDVRLVGNSASSWTATNVSPGTSSLVPLSPALLPDLTLWVDPLLGFNQFEYVDTHRATGRKLLRFTTATPNIGQGPLILEGREASDGRQEVVQIIRREDGTEFERVSGEFVYHPTHNHVHFDDYAVYQLREITESGDMGDVVASGGKISFCLIDFSTYNLDLPNAPTAWKFTACETSKQGISVGWADIYGSDLDDQWIDIADVPAGEYWLETIIDPHDLVLESDETNNSFASKIVLGAAEYAPDHFDAKETNLVSLGTGDKKMSGLSIHRPGDIDTFRWIAPTTGDLNVSVEFDEGQGDVDLYVWGRGETSRKILIESATDGTSESGTAQVTAGDTYFIVLKDLSGETLSQYSLEVNGPEIEPDDYENNDRFDMAFDVGSDDVSINGLNAHQAGDRDYFAWTAAESGNLYVDIRFASAEGQIDLYIYDSDHNVIVQGIEGSNREQALIDVVVGETYLILVVAHDNDFVTNYDLRIDFLDIEPDEFEPNDRLSNAADVGLGNIQLSGLNIHEPFNRDFFKWIPTANGTAQVDLNFAHDSGDLDLVVWYGFEELSRISTRDDNESFSFDANAGEKYFIEVVGKDGAVNSEYELVLTNPSVPRVVATTINRADRAHEAMNLTVDDQSIARIYLPGVDQISLQFNKSVSLTDDDWTLTSDANREFDVEMTFDDERLIATWTFTHPLVDDLITITLMDSIVDAFQNTLDGDLNSDGLPSGNGDPGGEFVLQLHVLLGDVTGDGSVDIDDIDALSIGLQNGDPQADLNGDGLFGNADVRTLIVDIMGTVIGDSNLDGVFDSTDLIVVFEAGEYEDGIENDSTWAEGDWNSNGDFDTNDLVFAFQSGSYVIDARATHAFVASALNFDSPNHKQEKAATSLSLPKHAHDPRSSLTVTNESRKRKLLP